MLYFNSTNGLLLYSGYMEFLLCVTHYDGLYARGEKEFERLF